MTRKRRRLYVVIGALVLLSAATALVIGAFRDNLVFFFSPTELVENSIAVSTYPYRRFGGGWLFCTR